MTTLMWHDTTNMLSALQDGRFTVWYYPRAVYIDMELLPQSKVFKDAGYVIVHQECWLSFYRLFA